MPRTKPKSIGRDYDSILKTKLGGVVIEGDRELARKRLQQIVKMPEDQFRKRDQRVDWINKSTVKGVMAAA